MIPTVNVTVAVHGQDGTPVRDALVFARLTTVERYNGYVVAGEYEGRTDERGRAVVAVFPNELGSEGSEYRFRIVTPAGRTFSVYATVPNSDCNLHQICELEPSERRGAGQVVSTEMAGYVTQAETARDKSQEAANRAQAAAVQVDVSAQTATAAASQALSNANAAKRAAEEATGLVQRTETAVAGFESEVIGRVEAETQRLGGEASTAVSTAKDQAMTALDAHMEQKTEGLDLHAADLKAALTASLGTREEEAIGAVRIERDAALVVLREEGAQFREDLNTLAERSEDAAKRAACSAAITVKAASDVDEALTDTALDLLAPQVVVEAVRQATEIALDSANTATVEAEKSRQSAATACACADESAASAQGAADSAAAAETSAGAAADSASVATASEAVATAKAGEASTSATAAKASENAAKASEQTATEATNTATTKAGEASVSAAAAGVSEANAAASATAAADSANVASAAQTAAEAACEETKKVAVLPATTTTRGSVMLDGLTISVTADGTITAKDVAIGGNLGDLASARGQIGDNIRINTASDLNAYTKAGNWLFSDAAAGENFPNIGRGGELNCYVSTTAIFQFFTEFNNNRRYIRYGIPNRTWTNWIQFISVAQLGDGIRTTQGIISVPEYEGATASKAGTSGLVPPATAGQQDSFLTGGGEYKPALTKISDSVSLADSTTAASAKAVKTAYDAAESKLPLAGGLMTGHIHDVAGDYTETLTERYAHSALVIRENDYVAETQSDIGYAPSIGFFWLHRVAGTLVLNSEGIFQFLDYYGNRARVDCHVPVADVAVSANGIGGHAWLESYDTGGVPAWLIGVATDESGGLRPFAPSALTGGIIHRGTTAPDDTLKLWINTADGTLNYHNGSAWVSIVGRYADA
ncbi:Phage tail fiber protein [Bilophila wadsworthia]|uniref:hypothetical protein n=1 Tax=Bilophila wadsworthia TaxID=35833 RepID=UPI003D6E0827